MSEEESLKVQIYDEKKVAKENHGNGLLKSLNNKIFHPNGVKSNYNENDLKKDENQLDHLLLKKSKDDKIDDDNEKREQWSNYAEYMLSVVGFVIDLGNVWRFPTVCYRNGGGAFLVPYLFCLFFIGMPCMYLELAMGQYFQSGNISIWNKIAPYMKGIGYSVILINLCMLSYYMTVQSYALYYLFYSFRLTPSWSQCNNKWNTKNCIDIAQKTLNYSLGNFNESSLNNDSVLFNNNYAPTNEFFRRKLLGSHLSTGFDDLVGLKWDLVGCILVIFMITTVCLIFGIKSSGKAVYVTAILPYICLIVLLIQSATLEGASTGILYYITPNFSRLLELRVWLDAAVQIFFSLGPGFGVLIAYSSYSPKSTNIQKLTILCSITNCITSFLYGVVVFAGIGYLATKLKTGITTFLEEGSGLVYIVYPEIIATFKGASIFAIIFFLMLISLGIDSAFGGMEGLYTAIIDEFPILKKHTFIFRLVISFVPFLTSLATVTYGGSYVVQWLDAFSVSPSVLVVVLVELITIGWIYGLDKFSKNIKEMNFKIPFIYWRISWKFICPICLIFIILFTIVSFQTLEVGDYKYPLWSSVLGWLLNIINLLPIAIYPIYRFIRTRYFIKNKNDIA